MAVLEAGIRPGELDLEIAQGATFPLEIQWTEDDPAETPRNLTGWEVRMMIRRKINDSATLLSLSTEDPSPALVITDAANGIVNLTIPDEVTATLPPMLNRAGNDKRGVYDIEYESPGGEVYRLLAGRVEVTPEVTR